MDLGLKGRVALVTGGSKGLGKATAMALAREGAQIALAARSEKELHAACEEIAGETKVRVVPIVCDVAKHEDVERAVARTVEALGALHVVIANGGGPPPGTFEELDEAAWQQAIDGTFLSVVRLARAAIPHMKHAHFGRFVVITSSSTKEPILGLTTSNAMRPAIVGLCKTLAKELGPHGITVNNVGPGVFDTERIEKLHTRQAKAANLDVDDIRRRVESSIPVGRIGAPEEFARLVAFLCSEGAGYLSGQTILVDGAKSGAY